MRDRLKSQAAVVLLAASVAASIVYVAVSQFDLYDSATGGQTGDSATYTRMATTGSIEDVGKPYRYRVVVPFAAYLILKVCGGALSGLDADERVQVVFGVLNLVGLTVAGWALYNYLRTLRISEALSLVGVFLFLTSWTILRFGGAVLVDSWSFAALAGAAYAIAARRYWLLLVAITVGIFVRETTVLALVFVFLLHSDRATWLRQAACFAPGVLGYALFRFVLSPTDDGYTYSLSRIVDGIADLATPSGLAQAVLNLALTFGAVWVLFVVGIVRNRGGEHLPTRLVWLVPVALVIPFLIGSNMARIWFLAFPAVVPLALVGLAALMPSVERQPERAEVSPT